MRKKALIIYNDPFNKSISGTHNRIINILKILKECDITIDQLVRYNNKKDNIKNDTGELINRIIYLERIKMPLFKKLFIKYKINKKLSKRDKQFFKDINIKAYKFNFLIENLKRQININEYNYVISVNSDNAFWIDTFGKKTKKILLMEDPMFNQFRDRSPKHLVDEYLEDYKNYEAKIINKFDYIFGISQDEINIFKNEQNKDKFIYLPAFMDAKNIIKKDNYKYDIIYVAHDNIHNVNAIRWFLDNVYDKLKNIKILFVGKICNTIDNKWDYKNIDFIDFIENIDEAYNEAKISICPMFSGTGLKIKVVEAFAYGKPVVCNKMGAIGQPNLDEINAKAIFISDNPDEFIKYIHNLLKDQKLYDNASKVGLEYFNKYFLTEKNLEKIKKVFND